MVAADLYAENLACKSVELATKISLLSVVVPVYNEEGNIEQLHSELTEVLPDIVRRPSSYEILYVDDGSTDSTFPKLEQIYQKDRHVRIIRHHANRGQTAALLTGFRNALGDVIVTIDADLQHDPRDIGRVVEPLLNGSDAVIGWRMRRKESFFGRTAPSRVANFLGRRLLGVQIHDFGCGLKAYKAECLRNVTVEGEGHLFLPAAVALRGYRLSEVKVTDRGRASGLSKFGRSMMARQFIDLVFFWFLVKYWRQPLLLFGSLGIGLLIIGICAGIIQLLRLFLYHPPSLMTPLTLLAVFLALAGLQFLSFGILLEFQMRPHAISLEVQPATILSHDEENRRRRK